MVYVRKQQRGMTGIALAVSLAVLLFFIWLMMVLFPIYYENFKVGSHLNSLSREIDLTALGDADIIDALMRSFSVDDVENVTKEDVSIQRNSESIIITIEYEVRKNVMGNVDVVVNFVDEEKYKL